MHFKVRKNTFTRKNKHAGKRSNHKRSSQVKTSSVKLDGILDELNLYNECINSHVINENCGYEKLSVYMLEEYGEDFIGNENPFGLIIPDVNKIMNFKIETCTMTIFRTDKAININLVQFRKDFMIEKLFRIKDVGLEKCYVVISRLEFFWVTSSLDNFIDGPKKMKLIDGKRTGTLIWAWLKKFYRLTYGTCDSL